MQTSRVLEKGLWGMSAPMFIDQAVIFTIPIIDMYFLSRTSDTAAAAVGAITPLVFVATSLIQVTAYAGASIAGQWMGAQDVQRSRTTMAAYFLLVVILSFMAALSVNHGGPWIATLMSLGPVVEQEAVIYLSWIGWMVALWGVRCAYQTFLNTYGEPKWNTFGNLVLFFSNILANIVAVYYFSAGVRGVAIANIGAAFLTLLFLSVVVHGHLKLQLPFREGLKNFRSLMAPVFRIAGPASFEPISFQSYMIVLNVIAAVVSESTLKMKIYTYNTFLFCLMISIALSMATEAIIAQRVGRQEFDRAHLQLKESLRASIIGASTLAVLWVLLNQPLLHLFTQDESILRIGFWIFFLGFLAEPLRTINIVVGGALRCTGDATFTSVSSLLVIWFFSVPLAYFLAISLHGGIYGLLIAAIADEGARAAVKLWRWNQGHWQSKGVVQGGQGEY